MSSNKTSDPTHIKDLVPDPSNRRAHNPQNIGMVSDALRACATGRLRCGNGS